MVNPRGLGPKDWSPLEQYGPAMIFQNLRKIASNISFRVDWEEDESFVWDGDGEDPREEGYIPFDVDVYAETIVNGELVSGRDSLGGVYEKSRDQDPDVHGYLPQLLDGAAAELEKEVGGSLKKQLQAARKYLKEVLRGRHKISYRG